MVEVEVAMICYKFIRTPTSHGHVEFPTWKFSFFLFFLPPPQSPTDLLAVVASICPTALMPYLQSLQVQSLTPNPTSLSSLADAPIATLLNLALVSWKYIALLSPCGSQPTRCTVTWCPFWYEPSLPTASIHLVPLPTLVSTQVF